MRVADYINALPDSYKKDTISNNYKLLSLEQGLVQALRNDIEAVQETMDIRTATGKTLDLYGSIYGQARGKMIDEQFRYVILQKVAQCLAGGDHASVVKALAEVFGVSPSEFVLLEHDCEVEVGSLPFDVLQNAGLTSKQAWQLVKTMLPAGVRLAPMSIDGTFEFAEFGDELDENAGFADIEQTVGGYFGLLETGDTDIPI